MPMCRRCILGTMISSSPDHKLKIGESIEVSSVSNCKAAYHDLLPLGDGYCEYEDMEPHVQDYRVVSDSRDADIPAIRVVQLGVKEIDNA